MRQVGRDVNAETNIRQQTPFLNKGAMRAIANDTTHDILHASMPAHTNHGTTSNQANT